MTTDHPPPLNPDIDLLQTRVFVPAPVHLKHLHEVAPPDSRHGKLVADIGLILQAQAKEAEGLTSQAVPLWKEAVKLARGRLGKLALEGWLKAYASQLEEQVSEEILVKLVFAEISENYRNSYIRTAGLDRSEKMADLLRRLVPDRIKRPIPIAIAGQSPKNERKIPTNPLEFIDATREVCADAQMDRKPPARLTANRKTLWEGLMHVCSDRFNLAAQAFDLYLQRAKQSTPGFRWVASANRIRALRILGRRSEASDEYLRLMSIWQSEPRPKAIGMTASEALLKRIDDSLWAARYRALTGHYRDGKKFALLALRLLNTGSRKLGSSNIENVREFKAEAYHILSFRIALEQGRFDEALSYATLGADIAQLENDWRDRFHWYLGFYHYLSNNSSDAKRYWERLLEETKDEGILPQLHFWLAKVCYDLGNRKEGNFYYHALTDEYPLSYYAVVAPTLAEFSNPKRWQRAFQPREKLYQGLMMLERFTLDPLRHDKDIADDLLRAEIVVAAGLGEPITDVVVGQFAKGLRAGYPLSERTYPLYVYLSRLEYAASRFVYSISTTTQLALGQRGFWSAWPDQITVYFPRPFADIYRRRSQSSGVDVEMLMAVSRQETSFRPKATSAAGAIGMMQLIPPTARRMANQLGLDGFGIESRLKEPEMNVTLGAEYLRTLSKYYKGFEPAIYAAYNAGEYAVDRWLERRQHSDVLIFVEMIPFGETKGYTRNVMRNVQVYRFLNRQSERWSYLADYFRANPRERYRR